MKNKDKEHPKGETFVWSEKVEEREREGRNKRVKVGF